jgi:hypothetical protein
MNVLMLAESYLKDVSGLRFEWSLKITQNEIKPRPAVLFWITNYNTLDNQFSRLHDLLSALDCPKEIISQAKIQDSASLMQGVMVSLNENAPQNTFYIHSSDVLNQNMERVGFKWKQKRLIEKITYNFFYFQNNNSFEYFISIIHPALRDLAYELIKEPLLNKSGFYIQKTGEQISEAYITYPWHPTFKNISTKLENQFLEIDASKFDVYKDHCFRHIGFGSSCSETPIITVYFSARYKGNWPLVFESFQEIVKVEGEILNKELNNWVQSI